jgi:phosphosulfolactate synthase (CoM biosynthesis protein A)
MRSKQPERSFPFLQVNQSEAKPRMRGLTEIRGPYYSVVGRRYLEDLFEMMGAYVDSLKFARGSFTLMPEKAVREIIDLCHKHDVLVQLECLCAGIWGTKSLWGRVMTYKE